MELSIICVNWNSEDYLEQCLASIYEHTNHISFEVIIVDNASQQSGIERIAKIFPDAKIIRSLKNLGFAAANNLGYQQATGEHVLFLNPDTKLIGPTINILLKHIKSLPDAGIVGCKLLNSDLSVQLSSIQQFPTILNQVIDAEYLMLRWPHCSLWKLAPLFSENVEAVGVDAISGACMLLKSEVFRQVGMFSEEYFMYAEDLDLNSKVRRSGFRNYYVGETAVIHYGGRSSSQQTVSQWATVMKVNAMLRLFCNTRGAAYGTAYRTAMGIVAIARLMMLTLMIPLGDVVWERKALRTASAKWRAVLAWAAGRQELAFEQQR